MEEDEPLPAVIDNHVSQSDRPLFKGVPLAP